MGRILAVCISETKGTPKRPRDTALLVADHGLSGDAHAGSGRQVSLLAVERIRAFCRDRVEVAFGDFGENLVTEGIDFAALSVGDRLRAGDALLELTQFGKECHSHCRIRKRVGDCVMPRDGVFAKVLRGGTIEMESVIHIVKNGGEDV